jgi:hypothetical protein
MSKVFSLGGGRAEGGGSSVSYNSLQVPVLSREKE